MKFNLGAKVGASGFLGGDRKARKEPALRHGEPDFATALLASHKQALAQPSSNGFEVPGQTRPVAEPCAEIAVSAAPLAKPVQTGEARPVPQRGRPSKKTQDELPVVAFVPAGVPLPVALPAPEGTLKLFSHRAAAIPQQPRVDVPRLPVASAIAVPVEKPKELSRQPGTLKTSAAEVPKIPQDVLAQPAVPKIEKWKESVVKPAGLRTLAKKEPVTKITISPAALSVPFTRKQDDEPRRSSVVSVSVAPSVRVPRIPLSLKATPNLTPSLTPELVPTASTPFSSVAPRRTVLAPAPDLQSSVDGALAGQRHVRDHERHSSPTKPSGLDVPESSKSRVAIGWQDDRGQHPREPGGPSFVAAPRTPGFFEQTETVLPTDVATDSIGIQAKAAGPRDDNPADLTLPGMRPTDRVEFVGNQAHLTLSPREDQELRVHLDVRGGQVELSMEGPGAERLIEQSTELARQLADQGLTLGRVDVGRDLTANFPGNPEGFSGGRQESDTDRGRPDGTIPAEASSRMGNVTEPDTTAPASTGRTGSRIHVTA